MKMNKRLSVAVAVLLCVTVLTLSLTACKKGTNAPDSETSEPIVTEQATMTYYTAAPGQVKKSETVYVNLDESGAVKSTVVSDWLHTDKACVKVTDKSDLQNIVNIKSAVNPIAENDSLIWHMDSTDLYYRGTSNKKLPVDISVKYYLDGKEITADKIAGQSGKAEVRIEAKNNIGRKVKIDGKEQTVYSPFLLVGGMILPEDKYSAVTVENGKSIGDGSKEIVVFLGAPGMNQTLRLDSLDLGSLKLNFAETFSVKADVRDFELGNLYFAVLPLSTLITDMEIPETVDDIRDTLETLNSLQEALSAVNPSKLIEALVGSGDKIKEFTSMISDAVKLYQSNKALLTVLPKYLTEENITALTKLLSDLDNANLAEVQKLLSNPVLLSFFKGLPELAKDLNAVMPIVEQFRTDMENPEIKAALEALPETLNQLSALQTKINENREMIDTLANLLSEENLNKINKVLASADTDRIADTLSDYGALAEHSDTLIASLSAMLAPESAYEIYTQADADAATSVMFIYQTPSIAKASK
ncbi:MAG TPA: hypothetical protein DDY98_00115 [Ruminococcaceae bacterium]|nr:hypothetical protein [Oscillospiraceae bacterium]